MQHTRRNFQASLSRVAQANWHVPLLGSREGEVVCELGWGLTFSCNSYFDICLAVLFLRRSIGKQIHERVHTRVKTQPNKVFR